MRGREPLLEPASLLRCRGGQLLWAAHARQPTPPTPTSPYIWPHTDRQVEPELGQLGVKGSK